MVDPGAELATHHQAVLVTQPAEVVVLVVLGREREREFFYLTTHSTHFIYGYMASDIWLRTILIVKKETRCRHIGYSYRLTARVLLHAPSHRQDNTYHGLCYTSGGALAGTRNSSMGVLGREINFDIFYVEPSFQVCNIILQLLLMITL